MAQSIEITGFYNINCHKKNDNKHFMALSWQHSYILDASDQNAPMNLSSLTQLDLSEREIAIYKALLELGPSSIRDLADKSGFNRGSTYETLKTLVSKGIVSYLP